MSHTQLLDMAILPYCVGLIDSLGLKDFDAPQTKTDKLNFEMKLFLILKATASFRIVEKCDQSELGPENGEHPLFVEWNCDDDGTKCNKRCKYSVMDTSLTKNNEKICRCNDNSCSWTGTVGKCISGAAPKKCKIKFPLGLNWPAKTKCFDSDGQELGLYSLDNDYQVGTKCKACANGDISECICQKGRCRFNKVGFQIDAE